MSYWIEFLKPYQTLEPGTIIKVSPAEGDFMPGAAELLIERKVARKCEAPKKVKNAVSR